MWVQIRASRRLAPRASLPHRNDAGRRLVCPNADGTAQMQSSASTPEQLRRSPAQIRCRLVRTTLAEMRARRQLEQPQFAFGRGAHPAPMVTDQRTCAIRTRYKPCWPRPSTVMTQCGGPKRNGGMACAPSFLRNPRGQLTMRARILSGRQFWTGALLADAAGGRFGRWNCLRLAGARICRGYRGGGCAWTRRCPLARRVLNLCGIVSASGVLAEGTPLNWRRPM